MKKMTIKDYGLIGLSLALVASLYSGNVKNNRVRELESAFEKSQEAIDDKVSELDNMYESLISNTLANQAMRQELLMLKDRESSYYDVNDLQVMTFSNSNSYIVYAPKKFSITNVSEYDYLFLDTPCGKVVGGYEFEYIDPAIKSVSVSGHLVSYNKVIYCGDGANDGYMGVCFIANGEVIYRSVSKNNEEVSEYSYKNEEISLESLASVLGIEDENVRFNANELKVIEDSLNKENYLELK